ncbi:MAG: T9SS type A sorting domain-containing protein [Bacteroidales bacterium]
MKKKLPYLLIFSCLCGTSASFAQSGFVSAGGDVKNTAGTVSSSVGQVFTAEASNASGSLQEGIQQGYVITDETPDSTKINSDLEVSLTVKVYPNPTKNNLVLRIADYQMQKWEYMVFDMNGRRLIRRPITSGETEIQLSDFGNSIYFVRLLDGGKVLRNFKVIKQD